VSAAAHQPRTSTRWWRQYVKRDAWCVVRIAWHVGDDRSYENDIIPPLSC
jgi:hypothetical protein